MAVHTLEVPSTSGIVSLAHPRILSVGTHHKTGTVWMRQVFRAMAKALKMPRYAMYRSAMRKIPDEGRVLGCNWESQFPPALFKRTDAMFLHIIRDPRDVLLSGARYHETADKKNEPWLYDPRDEWDGLNYQQKLLSIADPEDRILFEMEHKHAETLRDMLDWDYANPNSIEIRYEDLIADTDCELFRSVLERFGLLPWQVDIGVKCFWNHSLFGGLAEPAERQGRLVQHVSSGKARQWPRKMPRRVAEIYLERFGDDLITLGYEKNKDWLTALQ